MKRVDGDHKRSENITKKEFNFGKGNEAKPNLHVPKIKHKGNKENEKIAAVVERKLKKSL